VSVRASASTSSSLLSYVWDDQWLIESASAPAGNGCSEQCSQTYLASNAGGGFGWTCGQFLNVFPSAQQPPAVTTNGATNVGQTSATLSATVNPNGASTTLYFDYGVTTSYGSTVTHGNVGSGTTPVTHTFVLTGLNCGTTYHYRARAQNSGGTRSGNDQSFTTSACSQPPPTVTTNSATNVGQTSATLSATVNPNGASTALYFDYGFTTSYGSTVIYGSVGSGTTPVTHTFVLKGLNCGTTYHYRARAQNSGGTTNGNDQTFNASACGSLIFADAFEDGGGGFANWSSLTLEDVIGSPGGFHWQPSPWYYTPTAGLHTGTLVGPPTADFDLFLYAWNPLTSMWELVASATTPSNQETIQYQGMSGYYVWGVLAFSGVGNYTLSFNIP
jgi:hypothetical protein